MARKIKVCRFAALGTKAFLDGLQKQDSPDDRTFQKGVGHYSSGQYSGKSVFAHAQSLFAFGSLVLRADLTV